MRKGKALTSRRTITWPLQVVLQQVNAVVRGWVAHFRYDAAKRTFAYRDASVWHRIWRGVSKQHPKLPWKTLRRRYSPQWVFQENGVELFRPSRVPVERYRFRGTKILQAWNEHRVETPVDVTPARLTLRRSPWNALPSC